MGLWLEFLIGSVVIGWGVWQLWSLRRLERERERERKKAREPDGDR